MIDLLLSDFDRRLLAEGTRYRTHEKRGASALTITMLLLGGVAFGVPRRVANRGP